MKKVWKSVHIWWSYGQEFGFLFFWLMVYYHSQYHRQLTTNQKLKLCLKISAELVQFLVSCPLLINFIHVSQCTTTKCKHLPIFKTVNAIIHKKANQYHLQLVEKFFHDIQYASVLTNQIQWSETPHLLANALLLHSSWERSSQSLHNIHTHRDKFH